MPTYLPSPKDLLEMENRRALTGSPTKKAPAPLTMSELGGQKSKLARELSKFNEMEGRRTNTKVGSPMTGVADALANITGAIGSRQTEGRISDVAKREAVARKAFADNPNMLQGLMSTDPGMQRVGSHMSRQQSERQKQIAAAQAAALANQQRLQAATLSHHRGLEREDHMGAEGVQTGMKAFNTAMGDVSPTYSAIKEFKSLTDPYHQDSGNKAKAGKNIPGMGVGDNFRLTPMTVSVDAGGNIFVARGNVRAATEIPEGAVGDKMRQDQIEAQQIQGALANIVATYGRQMSGLALTDSERANINRILSNTDWSNEGATLQAVNAMAEATNGARNRVFASTHPSVAQQVFKGYGHKGDGSLESWHALAGEPLQNKDWTGHKADVGVKGPSLTEGVNAAYDQLPSPSDVGREAGRVGMGVLTSPYHAVKGAATEGVNAVKDAFEGGVESADRRHPEAAVHRRKAKEAGVSIGSYQAAKGDVVVAKRIEEAKEYLEAEAERAIPESRGARQRRQKYVHDRMTELMPRLFNPSEDGNPQSMNDSDDIRRLLEEQMA